MSINENLTEIPLPEFWSMRLTEDGRKLFLDHEKKTTSWMDPRDRLTKPQNFADCIGQELPFGWEIAYDKDVGEYFIDHNTGLNQMEDPRIQWRFMQESMINEYLQSAKESIVAKETILQLKKERSVLANQELAHLKHVLQRLDDKQLQSQHSLPSSNFGSKNSLTSASSGSLCSKYDPDLLRAEIEIVRQRVYRLKVEENSVRQDLQSKQKGVETLAKINQSLKERPNGYSLSERSVLENRLCNLKKVIRSIDEEKANLLKEVAKLRDDVQFIDQKNSLPLEVPAPTEKASSASQTDAADSVTINRVAVLARARLQYNEFKSILHTLQQQLAALTESLLPAQLDFDSDQINLINEKEQLLRELKSVCRNDNAQQQSDQQQKLFRKMGELEDDLRQALKLTPQEMVKRSRLHEQKEELEWKIRNTGLSIANLERQLRSLSASTLSTSSLSSTSSCGSLTSGGSAHDLYYQAVGGTNQGDWLPSVSAARRFDDIRQRAQQLIGGNKTTTLSSPAAPSAAPISSSSCHSDLQMQRENSVGSGTDSGTRSVSAAVSDESVAGDSGVFDGGVRRVSNNQLINGGVDNLSVPPVVAQIMVTLTFDSNVNKLFVVLEKARNLAYLWQSACSFASFTVCAVQIRASLLPPAIPGQPYVFRTDWSNEVDKPVFKKTFNTDISLHLICNKILQLYVWAHCITASDESTMNNHVAQCVGEAQLNLAEFDCRMMRSQWINVLSSSMFAIPLTEPFYALPPPSVIQTGVKMNNNYSSSSCSTGGDLQAFYNSRDTVYLRNQQSPLTPLLSRQLNTLKEESSDESTVIPSQTSTLTRCKGLGQSIIDELTNVDPSKDDSAATTTNCDNPVSSNDLCLRLTVNDYDSDNESERRRRLITDHEDDQVKTCDRWTNTDFQQQHDSLGGCPVVASSNLSKIATDGATTRIRRLNRSDSDSRVALHKREPFKRNVLERRSLRWKRPSPSVNHLLAANFVHRRRVNADDSETISSSSVATTTTTKNDQRFRTSVDIDLELQTTLLRLEKKKEDVSALEKLKNQLEKCKSTGVSEADSGHCFLHSLNIDDIHYSIPNQCNSTSKIGPEERRARHIIKKAARKVQILNESSHHQPSASAFRRRINNLIKSSPTLVNVVCVNNEEVDPTGT